MPTYHLFSWGANSHGQLGLGNIAEEEILLPREVDLSSTNLNPEDIVKIIGGAGHSLILDKSGSLYTCGWNDKGQAGSPTATSCFQKLRDLEDRKIVDAACGWDSTMALTESGEVFTWGSNSHGQLGVKSVKVAGKSVRPLRVELGVEVQRIAMGLRHSAVITRDGKVFVCGAAGKGQLGVDVRGARWSDSFVEVPDLRHVSDVSCGQHHTAVITKNNEVFTWGDNKHGQLGIDPALRRIALTPVKVENYDSADTADRIYCGWTHTAILNSNGKITFSGRNTYGQIGRAQSIPSSECWKPEPMNSLEKIKQLSVGSEHNVALTDDGRVLSWGWNEHGNCGNGNIENIFEPVAVSLPKGFGTLVGTGAGHSFAVLLTD